MNSTAEDFIEMIVNYSELWSSSLSAAHLVPKQKIVHPLAKHSLDCKTVQFLGCAPMAGKALSVRAEGPK